jgi:ferredoxin
MATCKVTFQPSGRSVTVGEGSTVLSAAQQAGQNLLHFCGGNGLCQTCEIRVDRETNARLSPPDPKELRWFDEDEVNSGRRLGCCARVKGDIAFSLPAERRVDVVAQFQNLPFDEAFQLWLHMIAESSKDFLSHARHSTATLVNSVEMMREKGSLSELPDLARQLVNAGVASGIMAFEAVAAGFARTMTPPPVGEKKNPRPS